VRSEYRLDTPAGLTLIMAALPLQRPFMVQIIWVPGPEPIVHTCDVLGRIEKRCNQKAYIKRASLSDNQLA
jgi:hypothetical protein